MGKRNITPQQAKEWLDNNNNRNYRPMNEPRAMRFARDMRQDNWFYVSGQTIKFDWDGELIDGQKRLRAVVLADRSMPFNVETNLDPKTAEFLDMGVARSLGNMLANAGVFDPNQASATIRLGFDVELLRQKRSPNTPENQATAHEVLDVALSSETLEFSLKSVRNVPAKLLRRSIAAYCYNTLHEIDAYDCALFFHKLVELEDIDDAKDDAIKKLHKRLVYGNWPAKGKAHRLQVVATVFKAWNSWRTGEEIGKLQVNNTVDPKALIIPVPE